MDNPAGDIFLIMEYISGGSLREYLKQKGRLEVPEAFPTKAADTPWTVPESGSPANRQDSAALPPLQPDDAAMLLPEFTQSAVQKR